ncbi:MAG: dCTP deaminase, partial [Stellaceae bacterium]
LGLTFTKIKKAPDITISLASGLGALADSGLWKESTLKIRNLFDKRDTFVLEPDEFVLALTHEHVWMPKHLIALVEGRSTYARVGLSMHQTAPWIQPGWDGHITLEIRNSGPLKIELTPIIDMPCQLTFFQLTSALKDHQAYGSRATDTFQHQKRAIPKRRKSRR